MVDQIILGDCSEVLKTLPDESVHAVVTDPPYGLGTREPTGKEIVAYLLGAELQQGGDFMQRAWNIPSVAIWRECFRVLKPGGHLLSFGGTRTFDLISVGVRAAGFECRDTIASQFGVMCLQWVQGQGFPKSASIQKQLVKQGLTAEEAAEFEGLGTALKPSWEPVLCFRKPISEATIAKQVLATGTGALNIEGCRVSGVPVGSEVGTPSGRWPSNFVLSHGVNCKRVGTHKVDAPVINRFTDGMKPFGDGAGHAYESEKRGDTDGKEEIAVYECQDGCPVKLLDGQSGPAGGAPGIRSNRAVSKESNVAKGAEYDRVSQGYDDAGGASRFFPQFEQLEAPFLYQAKVGKKERDEGLPTGTNRHPCLKSVAIMKWLCRLVTAPGGTILDPFCGSGSTLVAAIKEGFQYIGIERDPEFHHVAELRCRAAHAQPDVFAEMEQL